MKKKKTCMNNQSSAYQGKALFAVQLVTFCKDLSILFPRCPTFNFLQHWLKLRRPYLLDITLKKSVT